MSCCALRFDAGLDKARAERLDLVAHRRADVEGLDHGAEPPAGGDRLQARDTGTEDERARRGDRAGRGHHQREDAGQPERGHHGGVVPGKRRHRREHVHVLGPADARHGLQPKCGHAPVDEGADHRRVAGGLEHTDQDRSPLHLTHEGDVRAADDHDDVRIGDERRPIRDDLGAHLDIRGVGDAGGRSGTRLNRYRCTRGHQLRRGSRNQSDPGFVGRDLGGSGDAHAVCVLYGSIARTRCPLTTAP